MTAPNSGAVGDARKREADRTEPGRLSHPDPSVREQIREAQERALREAADAIRSAYTDTACAQDFKAGMIAARLLVELRASDLRTS